MKHLTLVLSMLLITTLMPLSAKKPGGNAPVQPSAAVTVSCAICISGSAITISATGFANNSPATLTVNGPYTAVTLMGTDNSGNFSVTYLTGLHWPIGSYNVTVTQVGGSSASTSFSIQ